MIVGQCQEVQWTLSCFDSALALLRQTLDDPTAQFREGQWEAIAQLVTQRARLLVVQRTGWGELVKRGKQRDGRFDDALVQGLVDMIRDRWQPAPNRT